LKGKQEHYGEMPMLTLSQASRRINSLLNSAGHGGERKERKRKSLISSEKNNDPIGYKKGTEWK